MRVEYNLKSWLPILETSLSPVNSYFLPIVGEDVDSVI